MTQLRIKTQDSRLKDLEEIQKSEIVYIWGCGSYSRDIKEYLQNVGSYTGRIIYITDDEYYKPGTKDTISLSQFIDEKNDDAPVVFGFYNYPVIQKKKNEWSDKYLHMYDFHLAVVNGKRLTWDPF